MSKRRRRCFKWFHLFSCAGIFTLIVGVSQGEFVSFNDEVSGAGTAANVTSWNALGMTPGSSGYLKDVQTGAILQAKLTITTNGPVSVEKGGLAPDDGTPLFNAFNGYVDFGTSSNPDAMTVLSGGATVTYTFSGLYTNALYSFETGVVRGGSGFVFARMWTEFQLDGAQTSTAAHSSGCVSLSPTQAVINTGENSAGDMVVWTNITPSIDGTFSITCSQYTNSVPDGSDTEGLNGFGLAYFRLSENNTNLPRVISVSGLDDGVKITFSIPLDPLSAANPSNYILTNAYGPVVVLTADVEADGQTVDLTTGGEGPFLVHWLQINNVSDALTKTNPILAGTMVTFTNMTFTTGYFKNEFYTGLSGTSLSVLTNSANFPDHPTRTKYTQYSYWSDTSIGNNYGCKISGIVIAPVSGTYWFGSSSPGQAAVFVSTNEDAAGKQYVGQGLDTSSLTSVTLVQGTKYYVEWLGKEGTGASDYFYGAWLTPKYNNWNIIYGSDCGNYISDSSASVSISAQPTSKSIYEARSATLSVMATTSSKIVSTPAYQWQCNGTNIPGATGATYTTPLFWQTNSGNVYRVCVFVPGASVYSSSVVVTVTRDLIPPSIVNILNFGNDRIQMVFSEPVNPSDATNVENYVLQSGEKILNATLDESETTVVLTTEPLIYGSNYTVRVNGISDVAFIPNPIEPDTEASVTLQKADFLDIGSPAIASTSTLETNGVTISAAGTGTGGTKDQFNFNAQVCAGEFDLKVRVERMSLASLYSKAGLMARETMNAGSRYGAVFATPSINDCFFEYRSTVNSAASTSGDFPVNFPATWLRLKREGNIVSGYAGYDGVRWTLLGQFTTSTNLLYVGIASSSQNSQVPTQITYRDYSWVEGATSETVMENPHEKIGPCSRKTPIVFSEIMYKPATRKDGRNLEFIEIYNSNPWFHNISGYRIVGNDLDYTFPDNTQIEGGAYLVIAASPDDIQSVYDITNVVGPYNGSLKKSDSLQLIDEHGAILLTVPYSNLNPWPVAADGTGHSLVLANPSYGEADPRAWDISQQTGGSPGSQEPFYPTSLSNVLINEILVEGTSGTSGFVELYNHGQETNDLSGCFLTDDASFATDEKVLRYTMPKGTSINPGGFVAWYDSELGFKLSPKGGVLYLVQPDGKRVLCALQYEPQVPGISYGRRPNGTGEFYPLATTTPGAANGGMLIRDVVINELMYHPISGNDDDQYIELFNKGAKSISLAGWKFTSGVSFTFPTNVTIEAGGYLVVARNMTNLFVKYSQLTGDNTVGNYSGKLAHGGERVALAMPQTIISGDSTDTVYVVVDEVSYGTGGRWGRWAAGGGSSLELTDPRSNHRLASNWADSDETSKAPWTSIESTGKMDNGGSIPNASGINFVQFGPLDEGECLVDHVEVLLSGTTVNLVKNPDFESGVANWSLMGCMTRSSLENSGYQSGYSLHVRCSSRVWTGVNSCQADLNKNTLSSGKTVTLRYKARWLHGCPEVLLRLAGNWYEAAGCMTVPANLGTPGLPNSRYVSSAAPAIYDVSHSPAVPGNSDSVIVTAKITGVSKVSTVTLKYRDDSSMVYTEVSMKDDGSNGDAIAGDGVFSGIISAPYYQTLKEFVIYAKDASGKESRFPSLLDDNSPDRECVVMFGDSTSQTSFGVYHYWLSTSNLTRWSDLPNLSNETHDGTFVNGKRIIYNMGGRYAGSPFHQNYWYPLYDTCHFKWVFPEDDKFLGATSFNKIHAPGNSPGDDASLQREQVAYMFMRALGVPWLNRRYVALYVNGNRNSTLMEDTQCPDSDMIDEYFPDDDKGFLFKMQPWFEFSASYSGTSVDYNNVAWCTIMPYTTTDKVKKTARYRYNYEMRQSPDSLSNFTNVFTLIDAASSYASSNYVANLENLADMENWMRVFAANHAAGNWDSFGANNAQNLYGYVSGKKGYSLMMFDFNIVIGNSGSWSPGQNLFTCNSADGNLARIYANPTFRRMYWRALQELVNGPLTASNSTPLIDAKYNVFVANKLSVESTSSIKSWLQSAKNSITSQLKLVNASSLTLNSNVTVTNGTVILTGLAPVNIKTILINGVEWPLVWNALTGWTVTIPLKSGTNSFTAVGVDRKGNTITSATNTVQVVYDDPQVSPVGAVVINEIMFNPSLANAQYVELLNNSSNVTFDLSGWKFHGLDYVFPSGSILAPKRSLVLAANRSAYAAAYGATTPIFDTFDKTLDSVGDLSLAQPDATGTNETTIARVVYDCVAPWPLPSVGKSLQLVDPSQDDWRVGNWVAKSPTPAAINGDVSDFPILQPLWINEVQSENVTGLTNDFGLHIQWIELFNPGTNSVSLDGLYLATSYTNLTEWEFPTGEVVKPGEFKVVMADGLIDQAAGDDQLHAALTLSPETGAIALCRLDDSGNPLVLDYVNYTNVPENASYGSVPDGQSFVRYCMYHATPGASNDNSGTDMTIAVNEWMAANTSTLINPATGKYDDWFELYNFGTNTVDLAGCYLANSVTNATQFKIPSGYSIAPKGFLLVWADKKSVTGTAELHANFKLNKAGSSVALFSPSGLCLDAVTFGQQTQDVSCGRFSDGSGNILQLARPTPAAANIWTNHPPVLSPFADQLVFLGQTLSVSADATDLDSPSQILRFMLGDGSPAGAIVDSATGVLSFTPTVAPATNQIQVIVFDDAVPSASDTQTVTIRVLQPPSIHAAFLENGRFTLQWMLQNGITYQVEYKDDLSASGWTAFDTPKTGADDLLTITNAVDPTHNRFFRIRIVK